MFNANMPDDTTLPPSAALAGTPRLEIDAAVFAQVR